MFVKILEKVRLNLCVKNLFNCIESINRISNEASKCFNIPQEIEKIEKIE